jgi:tetratricopeptide (TPR) repeat protein
MKSVFVALALALTTTLAHAQQGDVAEAGKRFNAGVTLYSEADYRAALVEFKRAYEIAPNPAVLYNIGQTQYQLQDYAAAYLSLTRYLAEAGADADHKEEVTKTLATLASRVGKINVMANVEGAEVRIDDELVGKTPLAAPVLVSVGRRKVEISMAGRASSTSPPATRSVRRSC